MKFILLLLAIITPAGVWLGYRVGSQTSTDAIYDALLNNIEVTNVGNDKYVLNFVCEGKVLAAFDVDSDQIISAKMSNKELFRNEMESAKRRKDKNGYQRIYETIVAFVTGGGAVKFGKPVIGILRAKENSKYTIPALIGGLSGFYLGYELAIRNRLDCNDFVVVATAQEDLEAWTWLKRAVASVYVLQQILPFSTEHDRKASGLEEVSKAIQEKKVNSSTFAKLESVSAYIHPKETQSDNWLTFDLMMAVYIPVLLLLMGAVGAGALLIESLSKTVRRRRARQSENRAA